jgi:PleD family two-component response regulator
LWEEYDEMLYLFSEEIIDYYLKTMPLDYTITKIVDKYKQLQKNKNYKILIVDDSAFSRNLMKKILIRNNFNIKAIASGKYIIEAMEGFNPNLILVDIEMPNINGL